jgi:hypothetical protein
MILYDMKTIVGGGKVAKVVSLPYVNYNPEGWGRRGNQGFPTPYFFL